MKSNPSDLPRSCNCLRFCADCSGEAPYFSAICSAVQLERMPTDARANAGGGQRLFQLAVAHDAPRTHHVRDDVDVNDRPLRRGGIG